MEHELLRVKEPKKFDFMLITILGVMALTSFVAIYSAFELITSDVPSSLLLRQIMWYVISFTCMGFLIYLGNDTIYSFTKYAYWFLLGALIYLFISKHVVTRFFGYDVNLPFVVPINGATSWFQFPGLGSFQPSEFMKVVLILITAGVIDEHNSQKLFDSYESDLQLFRKVLMWAVLPLILIFLQPDTGICLIIIFSLLVMIMCSGIKPLWIVTGCVLIIVLLGGFLYLYIFNNSLLTSLFGSNSLYKLDRIKGWLDPEADILHTGNQLYTALMAMGSAGITGHGMQLNLVNIPEAQTDFIFAVIGQSFGLLGTLFVVGLCLTLDLRLLRIAVLSKVMKEKYYISGVLGMLLFQQVQNIGMIIGLLPITGITLPFISYGGSSLLSYFIAISIIMNASMKAKKLSDYVYES
ncbi:MAG: FtsW/RodA/SpoVE family cell cycle protein [Erysipelotrichaceae bacterium]|nr:FtsW/RodA/SpoVE family cell cycle protein [Erysipelotrichaceae bacterium]MCI9524576.1 FtsW/RodA/SpoVE family cell cycle protein [Erysipelotrichaceae bacterium]